MTAANELYVQRLNQAIDHVLAHLGEPIRLEDVARAACFSPGHFHRIFRATIGETLAEFVTRLRLERALRLLAHDPRANLTRIALACGFGSSSNFSRVFKQHHGVAPSRFDLGSLRDRRRAELQALIEAPEEGRRLDRLPPGQNPDGFTVVLRELPARVVAYLRVHDPFKPGRVDGAAARFVAWAEERGVADGQWLGYMWDDPNIVALENCRYDVGLELPGHRASGEIGRIEFPAMRLAEIEVRGGIDLEQRALDWLYGSWLPSSGMAPSDQPCFEAWIGRPFAHGLEYFELKAQLPVVPV
ncbi:MAG: AraC family transcriptional regulator [Planctomycetes bacterium]|nr:AraC family transcriptional regulator [Planctomycetota bacterium]